MSAPLSSSAAATARICAGSSAGRSPCRLTTTSWRPSGSSLFERGIDAVGTGGQVRDRSGPPARPPFPPPPRSRARPPPPPPAPARPPSAWRQTRTIMGTPADIGQRLARQPGGRHAGGNEQDRVHRAFLAQASAKAGGFLGPKTPPRPAIRPPIYATLRRNDGRGRAGNVPPYFTGRQRRVEGACAYGFL